MKVYAKKCFKKEVLRGGHSIATLAKKIGMSEQGLRLVSNRKNGTHPNNAKAILIELDLHFNDIFEIVESEDLK